jgi:hypothetical protein
VLLEKDVIPEKYLNKILDPMKMTEPGNIDKKIIDEIRALKKNHK